MELITEKIISILNEKILEGNILADDIDRIKQNTYDSNIHKNLPPLIEKYESWYHYCIEFMRSNDAPENLIKNLEDIKNKTIESLEDVFNHAPSYRESYLRRARLLILKNKSILSSYISVLKAREDSFLISIKYEVIDELFKVAKWIGELNSLSKPLRYISAGAIARAALQRAIMEECNRLDLDVPKDKFQSMTNKLKEVGSLTDNQFKEINAVYGHASPPSHGKKITADEYKNIMEKINFFIEHFKSLSKVK